MYGSIATVSFELKIVAVGNHAVFPFVPCVEHGVLFDSDQYEQVSVMGLIS